MKSMTDLWRELANELASWCHTSTAQDYKKLLSRTEDEGLSFLTITLPSFGKDFERCLELGFIDRDLFHGFARKGGLPLFLGGFLGQIFNPSDGVILDDPSVDSIYAIRQLTAVFAKIHLPCSDARVRDAFLGYLRCETELKDWETHTDWDPSDFSRVSNLLFGDALAKLDELCFTGELIPRHGPGKTADRISGNQKFDLLSWSLRLESIFPFGEYAIPSWRYNQRYEDVEFLDPGNEVPVRVVHVPKTLRTPRIIAMEPAYMQYMQQAILQPMVEFLECKRVSGYTRDNLCSGFLGFTDQNPNRDLARQGSQEGDLATLDLSEASDRVHILHVEALLKRFPSLWEGVSATRSTKASVLPLGVDVYSLRKFASMGSALCFPIEAMVFLTTVFLGIEAQLHTTLTRKIVRSFAGKVRVYGDDIIVPVDYVDSVLDALSRLGYKVNVNKSFWNGKFRESCGGDYFDGVDVTPIRFKEVFPQNRADVAQVESLVAFRNLVYERGLWKTTSWLDSKIAEVLPRFPIVEPTSAALGRRSFLPYRVEKLDESTHAPRVRAYVAKPTIPPSEASGIGSLMKCLIPRESIFEDPRHLVRSGRPSGVN
ncbi:TPA_asm: RNA-directed RNA polymerase, partial [ssRNA phage Zoerhiza.2_13]